MSPERVFKTAWFAKASKKAGITDGELCEAIEEVMLGQADDLGGRVQEASWKEFVSILGTRAWTQVLGLRLPVRQEGSGQYRR